MSGLIKFKASGTSANNLNEILKDDDFGDDIDALNALMEE